MTDPGDLTLAAYEQGVQRYLERSTAPGPAMQTYLDRFAAVVGAGHVMELGSGPGWDATHLEGRGLRVTRTDATPAFLARLRAAGHDVRLLDVRTDTLEQTQLFWVNAVRGRMGSASLAQRSGSSLAPARSSRSASAR